MQKSKLYCGHVSPYVFYLKKKINKIFLQNYNKNNRGKQLNAYRPQEPHIRV